MLSRLPSLSNRPIRILDFDIEMRPLSWIGGDFVSREVTAIACKWIGTTVEPSVWLLGEVNAERMLMEFRARYAQADVVTGHYIRGYDLPNVNGALAELGLPQLGPKLTQDTKNDLVKMQGISKSQRSLAEMLDVSAPKEDMGQTQWRSANRLEVKGLQEVKRRVVGDVKQHIALRAALLERGLLRPGFKLWKPEDS